MDKEAQVAGTSIRGRWRDLDPAASEADPNKAFAQYISAAPTTPLGHYRQTIGTTPESFDEIPTGAKRVQIYNLSEDTTVYFTDFAGQEPDSGLGFPIRQDSWFLYDSEPTSDFLMATLSGTAVLALAFYA